MELNEKKSGYLKDFHCFWCGHDFKHRVIYEQHFNDQGKRKKHSTGSSTQCPNCFVIIPTSKRIIIDEITRRHIHER